MALLCRSLTTAAAQLSKDCSAKEKATATNVGKGEPSPGDGLRSLQTSSIFRAVNFELYTRPVKEIIPFRFMSFVAESLHDGLRSLGLHPLRRLPRHLERHVLGREDQNLHCLR